VIAGIDASVEAGLDPVKVNCVVMRGINDDEVVDLARFGRERGVAVRFIEFMPLDADGTWSFDKVVPGHEILERIDAVFPLEGLPVAGAHHSEHVEPAERFRYVDGIGDVGVIASVTEPFCEQCDRIRVTAEGKLRTCLFALDEFDLRGILRGGGSDTEVDDALAAEIVRAVGTKWAGHRIGQVDFIRPNRSMSQIGG
jgi:cyclic pyranopterin phosphate synthase